MPEALEALSAKGVRMAVLSNKPHDFTVEVVRTLCGEKRFEIVRGYVDDLPPKPNPAGALHIAGEMGLSPEAFVFVGDSPIDMRTACAAGMFPVGVLWGYSTEKELRDTGAQVLIESMSELAALLDGDADFA